ncbi:MAG TPA: serine hydrolase domain-containing protein [Gammaproteobacteria bacterium]|nr:serine hydrolase domain-containing protein [Gammaproteobacteria bacterium]
MDSRLILPVLLVGAVSWGAPADAAFTHDPVARADRLVQETMTRDHLPSLSVAVMRDGKLVYAHAAGLMDIAHRTPATPETLYPIGSVTKLLTATAALQLAAAHKLDLSAPIRRYCPAFPEKKEKITTRELLAHTSGIRHYDYRHFDTDFLNTRHYASIQDALGKFAGDPLVAEPGTKYHYSSFGYVVAACVIEGASGMGYGAYVERYIVRPAGMTNTRLNDATVPIPGRAVGYSLDDKGKLKPTGFFDPSDRYGGGGMLSTPTDLVRFVRGLLSGTLLDRQMVKDEMWRSATLASGRATGHGLGWDLDEASGAVTKGGTSVGATSYVYVRPWQGVAVAFVTNLSLWTKHRDELAVRLAELFAQGQGASKQQVQPGN